MYTKTIWQNGTAPFVNDENLNNMEQGIEAAHTHADSAHAPSDADSTANNETSHLNVVVDANYVQTEESFTTVEKTKLTTIEESAEVNTVEISENNVFTVAQRGQIEVLAYSASIVPDLSLSNRYKCVLTGDAQIENPTNIEDAQGGLIYLEQDVTGGHAVTWGTYWKFLEVPVEDTAGLKVNVYAYEVYSATQIVVSYIGAF